MAKWKNSELVMVYNNLAKRKGAPLLNPRDKALDIDYICDQIELINKLPYLEDRPKRSIPEVPLKSTWQTITRVYRFLMKDDIFELMKIRMPCKDIPVTTNGDKYGYHKRTARRA